MFAWVLWQSKCQDGIKYAKILLGKMFLWGKNREKPREGWEGKSEQQWRREEGKVGLKCSRLPSSLRRIQQRVESPGGKAGCQRSPVSPRNGSASIPAALSHWLGTDTGKYDFCTDSAMGFRVQQLGHWSTELSLVGSLQVHPNVCHWSHLRVEGI